MGMGNLLPAQQWTHIVYRSVTCWMAPKLYGWPNVPQQRLSVGDSDNSPELDSGALSLRQYTVIYHDRVVEANRHL